MDLYSIIGCFISEITGLPFCEGSFSCIAFTLVFQFTSTVNKKTTHLVASFHIGYHLLNELMFSDWFAISLTLMTLLYIRFNTGYVFSNSSCGHSYMTNI